MKGWFNYVLIANYCSSLLNFVKSGPLMEVGLRAIVLVGKDEGVKPYIQNVAKFKENEQKLARGT